MRAARTGDAPARSRAGAWNAAALTALLAVLVLAPAALASRRGHRRRPSLVPVQLSFDAGQPGAQVPADFIGLSFEMASLADISSYADRGDMVAMLRSLGHGVVRFGGVTSDQRVAWADQQLQIPPWAAETLEAPELVQLGGLATAAGWHVLFTINFGHFETRAAASEAAALTAALGPSLEAIEIGNEPNSYAQHGLRQEPWTFVQYDEQISEYRAAIAALAPGIPLAGPDVSGSSAFQKWGAGEVVDQRPLLLTGHHYPLGCEQIPRPSITRLLSPHIRELEAVSMQRYMRIAQEAEIPFRMDETNSVSCGGQPGISNTFASALWAVSFVTRAMALGMSGVNFEGNPANCPGYTPLCASGPEALADGQLHAQPEWYALLLARELEGYRPLETGARSGEAENIDVSSFIAPDGELRFVVVDDDRPGSRSISVRVPVGRSYGAGSVLSLTAPSPSSESGVLLGGSAVAPGGVWSAGSSLPRAANRRGVITVVVRPSSAVLLSVPPLP